MLVGRPEGQTLATDDYPKSSALPRGHLGWGRGQREDGEPTATLRDLSLYRETRAQRAGGPRVQGGPGALT